MADKYVVAAGGNWSAAGTWSLTDGGAGGAGAPSAAENAFLSNQSGNLVQDTAAATCLDLDFTKGTGYTGTFSGTQNMAISGSLTMNGAMTRTYTGIAQFNATTAGRTLRFNGIVFASTFQFLGNGGGYTLQDAMNIGATTGNLQLSPGVTFNSNNQTVTCSTFSTSNGVAATLTLGSSTWNVRAWQLDTSTTLNAGTSTINVDAIGGGGFNGTGTGGKTYATVIFTLNNSAPLFNGGGTFGTLTFLCTAAKTNSVAFNASITVTGALKVLGNSAINRILLQSSAGGTQRTITRASDDATCDFCNFSDINFAGAAGAFATGTSIGDCLGNSNLTATSPLTHTPTGTASFAWSTMPGVSRIPLPQDDVIINNAFVAGRTVSIDVPHIGRNITFTCTGSPALSFGLACALYGSIVLASGMTTSGGNGKTFSGRGSHTIQSNGVSWSGQNLMNPGAGTYALLDAFTTLGAWQISGGTFNDGGFTVTATSLNFFGSAILNKTGDWTLSAAGSAWSVGSGTINDTGGTIKYTDASTVTKNFVGGGKTYNNLWLSGAGLGLYVLTGSNTFNQVKADPGRTIQFTAATTQTAASWQIDGAAAVGTDRKYLRLFGVTGSNATTPDTAANSITGPLQLVSCLAADSWSTGNVIAKRAASNQVSFNLLLNGAGGLTLIFSIDGTTIITVNSTVATGFGAQVARWIMVTRDPTTGDVKFWTSADAITTAIGSVTWTQLGATVTAATGNMFDSTSIIEIGSIITGGAVAPFAGRIYRAAIYSTIGGSIVCDYNPEDHVAGTTQVASTTGETWTTAGLAAIGKTNCSMLTCTSALQVATIAKSGGGTVFVNNVAVSRSTASPASTFYAITSIDGGNDTNWTFAFIASAQWAASAVSAMLAGAQAVAAAQLAASASCVAAFDARSPTLSGYEFDVPDRPHSFAVPDRASEFVVPDRPHSFKVPT